jgi:prophage maintenance system killer protein
MTELTAWFRFKIKSVHVLIFANKALAHFHYFILKIQKNHAIRNGRKAFV